MRPILSATPTAVFQKSFTRFVVQDVAGDRSYDHTARRWTRTVVIGVPCVVVFLGEYLPSPKLHDAGSNPAECALSLAGFFSCDRRKAREREVAKLDENRQAKKGKKWEC